MRERIKSSKHCGIFVISERDDAYVPQKPSEEAQICLNCPLKKCNPTTCKRIKEERKKLKELQNER